MILANIIFDFEKNKFDIPKILSGHLLPHPLFWGKVPCEFEGVLIEKCFEVDDIVQVGQTIAIIEVSSSDSVEEISDSKEIVTNSDETTKNEGVSEPVPTYNLNESKPQIDFNISERFFSPLVKSIMKKEGIELKDLEHLLSNSKKTFKPQH